MKVRKNIFIKFFPERKNVTKFFICSYFLAFGLAENPIKADGPVLNSFTASTSGESCQTGSVTMGSRGANMGNSGVYPTYDRISYSSDGRDLGECLDVAIANIGIIDSWGDSVLTSTTQSSMTIGTVDIDGGAIDGTSIGSSSTSSGAFTTLSASSLSLIHI